MWDIITSELRAQSISIIKAVDITDLHRSENQGYKVALLIAKELPASYIHQISQTNNKKLDKTKFSATELEVDKIGEWLEDYLISKGHEAFAQSERNLLNRGFYTSETKTTPLPHKKIAVMAGLGWIGKNNLLTTRLYGNALCMCSVLTNAPIDMLTKPILHASRCGKCKKCAEICPVTAITGVSWSKATHRDEIVDVHECIGCLKCLALCPWTQRYVRRELSVVKIN